MSFVLGAIVGFMTLWGLDVLTRPDPTDPWRRDLDLD
jgi:hypothetical protein